MANPLVDVIPPTARKYVYAVYTLAGLVIGALTIAGVDVGAAVEVLAFIGVGIGATAASNATPGKHRA